VGTWRDWVFDLVWPRVSRGRSGTSDEKLAATRRRDATMMALRSLSTPEDLASARKALEELVHSAQEREAGIEERLRALIPVTAAAAAIIVGVGLPQLRGELGAGRTTTLFALAALYAVVELLLTLMAAVAGLERRSYLEPTPEDLFPRAREELAARERRLSELWYDVMVSVEEACNRKVEQMSVAHRALRNFIVGALVAAAVLVIAGGGP